MKFLGDVSRADWRRPSVIALVVANLAPLAGVLLFHWEIFPLMFLFWSENVIIGGFNVLRMLLANPKEPVMWVGKAMAIPFFCVHYGMFTFVHGMLIMAFFGGGPNHSRGFPAAETFWQVVVEYHLGWAILGLAVSRGISFVTNYLGNGEYKTASIQQLMAQPYGRIVVLHLAILFGGFLMLALHSPIWGLVLLIVFKIILDLRAHVAERKKFALPAMVKVD
jgi:hypothetical protein